MHLCLRSICIALSISAIAVANPVSASTYKVLYSFCHGGKFTCTDGKTPAGNLVSDSAGNLYGTTTAGGETGNGVIFELTPNGRKYIYQVLHSFDGNAEGGVPVTTLVIDTAGNLYGTATADGSNFGGTAFELAPNADHTSWAYTVLINFCSSAGQGCIQGQVPEPPLTYIGAATGQLYDGTSALYGTTLEGGAEGAGAVYSLAQSGGTWTGSAIYSFCSVTACADGQFPIGQLVLEGSGNLYGTTNGGGNGNGVAYRLATGTGSEAVLHDFCSDANCGDGNLPIPGLTLGEDGTLLGASGLGGKFDAGLLYTLNKSSGKEKLVYSFCHEEGCTDGIGPVGPPVPDAGTLVGAIGGGDGASDGLIYRIGVNNKQDILHAFCQEAACADGAVPLGVIVGPQNKLFGVTQRGGKRNDGVVFELTP